MPLALFATRAAIPVLQHKELACSIGCARRLLAVDWHVEGWAQKRMHSWSPQWPVASYVQRLLRSTPRAAMPAHPRARGVVAGCAAIREQKRIACTRGAQRLFTHRAKMTRSLVISRATVSPWCEYEVLTSHKEVQRQKSFSHSSSLRLPEADQGTTKFSVRFAVGRDSDRPQTVTQCQGIP